MTANHFVTDPEIYHPEEVKYESAAWSCSRTTDYGDVTWVYLSGNVGISYEWRATSPAGRHPKWNFICDVEFVSEFEPPITIQELRDSITRDGWASQHENLRGFRSIKIPEKVLAKILALRR